MADARVERYWNNNIFPKVKEFINRPVEERDINNIRDTQARGRSLPYSVAALVVQEGQFLEPLIAAETPLPYRIIPVARFYGWALSWISTTEQRAKGMTFTSHEGLHGQFERLLARDRRALLDKLERDVAELIPLLGEDQDPTAFSLLDKVMSAPELIGDLREQTQYPTLARRLATFGVESYKKYYLAVSNPESTP